MKFSKLVIYSCCLLMASQVFGQDDDAGSGIGSRVYAKVYGAYGLLTPGSFKGVSNNDNNDVNIVKVQKMGMGGGLRVGAGLGFIVNEYINLGIDGEYLFGNTIKVKVDAITGSSVNTQGVTTYTHKIFSAIPNIVFKAISKPTYYVYNRIGLVIGIPLSITEAEQSEYHFKNSTVPSKGIEQTDSYTSYHGEDKVKNAIGYQGVLGVQVRLTEQLRGFFEIAVYGVSFNIDKYEDAYREVKTTDKRKDISAPTVTVDNSTYERIYAKTGVPRSSPTTVSGTPGHYLYSYTLPESHINMNAITAGIGIAYRF